MGEVVSTGDELVFVREIPKQGQTRDCNRPMLLAALKALGVDAVDYGIIPDTAEAFEELVARSQNEVEISATEIYAIHSNFPTQKFERARFK